MEKKYNLWMDGEVIDRNLTREQAEDLLQVYMDADEDDKEDHYYMIKPVQ